MEAFFTTSSVLSSSFLHLPFPLFLLLFHSFPFLLPFPFLHRLCCKWEGLAEAGVGAEGGDGVDTEVGAKAGVG